MESLIWNWTPLLSGLTLAGWGYLQWSGRFKQWADPKREAINGYFMGPDAAGNLTMGAITSLLGGGILLWKIPGTLPTNEDWTPLTAPWLYILMAAVALLGAFYFYLLHWQPEWPNPAWYKAYQEEKRSQEMADAKLSG